MTKRDIERREFGQLVEHTPQKIRIGTRGSKNARDWMAVDKFDKGSLMEEHHDLHDLPYDGEFVDCHASKIALEHAFKPQLAIFEMYRTLKMGSQIWIEVPFNQFYHLHDFRRWTIQRLAWDMERFEQKAASISVTATCEIGNIAKMLQCESQIDAATEETLVAQESYTKYSARTMLLRLYSGCFWRGQKVAAASISLISNTWLT